jgi:hypothetical protein
MKFTPIFICIQHYLFPHGRKLPAVLGHFSFIKIILATLFLGATILSSCKTCKCPAYSETNQKIYEQKT